MANPCLRSWYPLILLDMVVAANTLCAGAAQCAQLPFTHKRTMICAKRHTPTRLSPPKAPQSTLPSLRIRRPRSARERGCNMLSQDTVANAALILVRNTVISCLRPCTLPRSLRWSIGRVDDEYIQTTPGTVTQVHHILVLYIS